MGIINRGRSDGGEPAGTTVIAAGTKLVGDLALSDNLHVDGEVEGTIRSESEVAIGESGRIQGDLSANSVMISGRFEGNVAAHRLEIVAGGRVDGDVSVSELVIESGALFNGNSQIRDARAAAGHQEKRASSSADREKRETKSAEGASAETAAKAG